MTNQEIIELRRAQIEAGQEVFGPQDVIDLCNRLEASPAPQCATCGDTGEVSWRGYVDCRDVADPPLKPCPDCSEQAA